MSPVRRLAAIIVGAIAVAGLTGCAAGTVDLQPAADANNPACADVIVRLPGALSDLDRRWTDAQSTGAWGDPAGVLLTCGVTPPGPSTLPCQTVNGVDWLIDDTEAPKYRVTSFGRDPAVEVYLDTTLVSSTDALTALSAMVSMLPSTDASCSERPTS